MKNDKSGGPAGMINPWIATSFPLYDLIVSVTPESARIESTSWAKVRRGISSEPARETIETTAISRPTASHARIVRAIHVRLGQWRKVFRDLRPTRQQRWSHSSQGPPG